MSTTLTQHLTNPTTLIEATWGTVIDTVHMNTAREIPPTTTSAYILLDNMGIAIHTNMRRLRPTYMALPHPDP
jgi:hypothetical protein